MRTRMVLLTIFAHGVRFALVSQLRRSALRSARSGGQFVGFRALGGGVLGGDRACLALLSNCSKRQQQLADKQLHLHSHNASDLGPYHDPSVRPSFKSRLCNMSSRSWLLARDPPLFYPTLNYPMASTHTNNASAGRKSATRKSSAASDTSSAIPTVAGSVYEYSRIIDGVRNDFIVSNFFTTFIGGFETKKIVIGTRPAFPDEDGTSTFPCHLTCSLTGNSVSISMRPPAA